MQPPLASAAPSDRPSRFPVFFELLVWGLYVGLYKYDHYVGQAAHLQRPDRAALPYPQLLLFALATSLYLVPYYRWLVPVLLRHRRYAPLAGFALLPGLWWGFKLNLLLAAGPFASFADPPVLAALYKPPYQLDARWFFSIANPDIGLLLTDALAFGCVAFVRAAFDNERRRRRLEQAHLALQLEQLKAQLQPHFLFNTLNSIYGLALAGSPEAPRLLLLLSELMRYVLYDSGKGHVGLSEEVAFTQNYFEMEQHKYPGARIRFAAVGTEAAVAVRLPPLLWLPLVENSFKHGRHHFADGEVVATLTAAPGTLQLVVENDMLPAAPAPSPERRAGGIGLRNLRQRLELYYPGAHELHFSEQTGRYRAQLTLRV